MAIIDKENKLVRTNNIDSSTFVKTKRFKKGDLIDFWYELSIFRHYKGNSSIHSTNTVEGFYEREEFENTFYKKD